MSQSAFPPFIVDPGSYPLPLPGVQLATSTLPTNSWFENAINNQIVGDSNRINQALPWYWLPAYSANILYIAHNGTNTFNNTTTNGNLIIQETPGQDILVGTSDPLSLALTNLDDFTATFVQTSSTGTVTAYPMRGSPYASFIYASTPVNIRFTAYPNIIGMTQTTIPSGFCYTIDATSTFSTIVNTSFVPDADAGYKINELSFYDSQNNTGLNITATFDESANLSMNIDIPGGITLTIGFQLAYTPDPVIPPYPSTVANIWVINAPQSEKNQNQTMYYPIITITMTDGRIFIVQYNLNPLATPFICTANYIHPTNYRWFIFTSAALTQSSGTPSLFTSLSYSGLVQIASGGSDVAQYPALQTLYTQYFGGYATSGLTTNFSGSTNNIWSFDIDWTLSNLNTLWLAPNHWNLMTITGMTNLTSSNYPLIQHFIYGNLTWYSLNLATSHVLINNNVIPLGPDISALTPDQKNSIIAQLIIDIPLLIHFLPGYTDPQSSTDPYATSQSSCQIGQMLALASLLGGVPDSIITNATVGLISVLTAYMDGSNSADIPNNPNVFQLQYESTWGGVIVPADYLLQKGQTTLGSFGNSFYNDHHFHWGYLLYALYTLELVGQGISAEFEPQITALITDIANPVVDTFSWKTRHKDWYAGHSFATGLTMEVVRQQESSGEAINGYYASYLMARVLSNTSLADVSGVCMWLELLASQQYYANGAPGSQTGILSRPGNIGILFNYAKAFTLDWPMTPDSFNGRAIGMYGIQTIPFTEITFELLTSYWVDQLSELFPSYAMTPELILGLMANTYNPVLTQNEPPSTTPFNVSTDGVFWGNVGLKILGFSTSTNAMTNADVSTAFLSGTSKQLLYSDHPIVKQFDSFSSTLYWLYRCRPTLIIS
jgi:endoglucanase Acf2